MKKLLICLGIAGMMFLPGTCAFADWSVTVTWTRSAGPNLDHETVMLDATQKCSVPATDPTTCQFNLATISGQSLTVRSYNSQGAYGETSPIILSAAPAPASGVMVNITYINP